MKIIVLVLILSSVGLNVTFSYFKNFIPNEKCENCYFDHFSSVCLKVLTNSAIGGLSNFSDRRFFGIRCFLPVPEILMFLLVLFDLCFSFWFWDVERLSS